MAMGEPLSKAINIAFTERQYEALWDAAEGEQRSLAFMVRRFCEQALSERGGHGRQGEPVSAGAKSLPESGPETPARSLSADTQTVYDHWRQARHKTRANYNTLSDARRKKIQSRLREFTAEDLCAAIDAVARDPWADRSLHDDLTVIFRSREQVERFLELPSNGAAPKLAPYEAAKAWVLTAGWRFPDADLRDELGMRFGMEGEQKARLVELAERTQGAQE